MPRTISTFIAWTTITTDKTTEDGDFNACTAWFEATLFDMAQILFEVQNTTDTSGVVSPGFQVCNEQGTILATTIFPSGGADPTRNDKTGDGVSWPNGLANLQSSVGGKRLIRFGFFFKGSSAGLKTARVSGQVEHLGC